MAAKQSAEMREALRLVASGLSKTAAAAQAGVGRTSLQAVLAKQRTASPQSQVSQTSTRIDS